MTSLALAIALLTPGHFSQDTKDVVCQKNYAKTHRKVSQATKNEVFKRYEITNPSSYVIDHLIPLEVGGDNDVLNLWPEPKDQAKLKDKDEASQKKELCEGRKTLAEVRAFFQSKWSE